MKSIFFISMMLLPSAFASDKYDCLERCRSRLDAGEISDADYFRCLGQCRRNADVEFMKLLEAYYPPQCQFDLECPTGHCHEGWCTVP